MTAPVRDPQPAPKLCGAGYTSPKMGNTHTCELPHGHAGLHQCALCGGQWPDITPTFPARQDGDPEC